MIYHKGRRKSGQGYGFVHDSNGGFLPTIKKGFSKGTIFQKKRRA